MLVACLKFDWLVTLGLLAVLWFVWFWFVLLYNSVDVLVALLNCQLFIVVYYLWLCFAFCFVILLLVVYFAYLDVWVCYLFGLLNCCCFVCLWLVVSLCGFVWLAGFAVVCPIFVLVLVWQFGVWLCFDVVWVRCYLVMFLRFVALFAWWFICCFVVLWFIAGFWFAYVCCC